jgi:hypothetical protein
VYDYYTQAAHVYISKVKILKNQSESIQMPLLLCNKWWPETIVSSKQSPTMATASSPHLPRILPTSTQQLAVDYSKSSSWPWRIIDDVYINSRHAAVSIKSSIDQLKKLN